MQASNRTFVCSVLFLDIAGYSRRAVTEQMVLKQRFNALLSQALQRISAEDRIVLDTGDGAAVTFLANPEDALFVAVGLRDAIGAEPVMDPLTPSVRFGINLGPARLITDLNGQVNMIGDGINVAQRVMGFSAAGQILITRSYHEVVSRLDPQFARLFRYEGTRSDKHVREHEVYAVVATLPSPATVDAPVTPSGRLPRIWAGRNRRLTVLLPVTMAVILSAGLAVRTVRDQAVTRPPGETDGTAALMMDATSSRRAASTVLSNTQAPPPVARLEGLSMPAVAVTLGKELPTAHAAPPEQAPAADKDNQRDTKGANASAVLLVVPWGEVVVNGQRKGVTPPLRVLQLTPGRHRIEIRNGAFPVHRETVDVRPGQKLTIRHRFDKAEPMTRELTRYVLVAAAGVLLAGCSSARFSQMGEQMSTLVQGRGAPALKAGISNFEEGRHTQASRHLQQALELGLASADDRAKAHKYLAFIHCASNRLSQCRDQFGKALEASPAMELEPAEAGHPVWGSAFRSVKARRGPSSH